MTLNNYKILYISSYNQLNSTGVYYKINGFLKAAQNFNYEVEHINKYSNGFLDIFELGKIIVKSNSKYIFIRSLYSHNLFLLFYLFIARVQAKELILDMPTPMKGYLYELRSTKINVFKKCYHLLLYYVSGPWVLWIFNRVIQYSEESMYFNFGNKNKTIIMGNGIEIDRIPLRIKNYNWPTNQIILVGVANVSIYHGFDRIIQAIYKWNQLEIKPYDIVFNIIGDGPSLHSLKKLTLNLDLEQKIIFHGALSTTNIMYYYSISHLAISSVGLFRLKLNESSVLKAREYCLAGIPFIACGKDPDFKGILPFRIIISNDENIDCIVTLFGQLKAKIDLIRDSEIRNYALNNLSFESKLLKLGFNKIESTSEINN